VYRLQKSIYVLKQSPRLYYKRFDKFLIGYGCTRSLFDQCIYFHKLPSSEYISLFLYIDDMHIASKKISSIDKLKV